MGAWERGRENLFLRNETGNRGNGEKILGINRSTRRRGDAATRGRGEGKSVPSERNGESGKRGKIWNLESGTPTEGWRHSGRSAAKTRNPGLKLKLIKHRVHRVNLNKGETTVHVKAVKDKYRVYV
jgi:hypothetical protein